MAFVNERISKEDRKKYKIDEIDQKVLAGQRDWTIDKERNIYLRLVGRGREEFFSHSRWHLFWEGELISFNVNNISSEKMPDGTKHAYKKLLSIKIPKNLEDRKDIILKDLHEALTAYKDGGVFATVSDYQLTLDMEK